MKVQLKKYPIHSTTRTTSEVLKPLELVQFARKNSHFYNQLYKSLPTVYPFDKTPVLNPLEFWKANNLNNSQVLTGPIRDGFILSSGGTTGEPKYSVFSNEEWRTSVQINAQKFSKSAIEPGDRIANIFHAGGLYSAFLFTTHFIEECEIPLIQYPISGHIEFSEIIKFIQAFDINVIIGPPMTIIRFTEFFEKNRNKSIPIKIKKIFYAGESLFEHQKQYLESIYPKVKLYSIGYASIDAGIIGYADLSCHTGEHRIFSKHLFVEILDEKTGQQIVEQGIPGIIVVTNLFRTLMPIIRYPVGDRGMWVEPTNTPDRKLKLLGRSDEGIKLGHVIYYTDDIQNILSKFQSKLQIKDFQILAYHKNNRNGAVLRISSTLDVKDLQTHSQDIIEEIAQHYPNYLLQLDKSEIHAFEIQWIKNEALETNKKTGKLLRIIDRRT